MPDFDFDSLEKDLKDSYDLISEADVMSAALYPQVRISSSGSVSVCGLIFEAVHSIHLFQLTW